MSKVALKKRSLPSSLPSPQFGNYNDLIFVFKVLSDFDKITIDQTVCVCVCVCATVECILNSETVK